MDNLNEIFNTNTRPKGASRLALALIFLLLLSAMAGPGSAHADTKKIHVFVALCDNVNQRGQKVPPKLGHGDKPESNLYWGAKYGIKTFLENDPGWVLVRSEHSDNPNVLRRLVFKHLLHDAELVADAYIGKAILTCAREYFEALAGWDSRFPGGPDLAVYIGHNVLYDFKLDNPPQGDPSSRAAIALACGSRKHFTPFIFLAGARPILLTNQSMAPEAYSFVEAVEGWLAGETPEAIRERAARVYASYQRCNLAFAMNIFSAGY